MARLQLDPREHYPFSFEIPVRTTDLNYGGHLGNDRLLALIQEARVAFLAGYGWAELACAGVSLIMGDTAVVYQEEAFAGDLLTVEVAAGEPTRCGFRIFSRVTRAADGKGIALVENGMICFDYDARKIRRLPAEVAAVFAAT